MQTRLKVNVRAANGPALPSDEQSHKGSVAGGLAGGGVIGATTAGGRTGGGDIGAVTGAAMHVGDMMELGGVVEV